MENRALAAALQSYDQVRDRYLDALRAKGVVFAESGAGADERARLRAELARRGVESRNAGASLRAGWLSKACVECTGNRGSETFATSFRCHRDCYFCFNYNLAGYERYCVEGCPWEDELAQAYQRTGGQLEAIALTGGEPLLNLEDSLAFLTRARELFPRAHLRMYTSGDLLTEESAARLAKAGLREIRFSVKLEDRMELMEQVLSRMELAGRHIPDVMVEMPIIPGSDDLMRQLLDRFAHIGITGMNLLEFCFPFHNWDEFARRGFTVRNPPFFPMYDYGYSGGLPIAGSEELALSLMLYALDKGYSFGLHYCSLENKHRSEMRQRNERAAHAHPCIAFDEGDFMLHTSKAYGPDRAPARALLAQAGCTDMVEDDEEDSTSFPPRFTEAVRAGGVTVVDALLVLESDGDGASLREIGARVVG